MILSEIETKKIIAGGLSGNLISAITRAFNAILDLGRALGSSIRRLKNKGTCAL